MAVVLLCPHVHQIPSHWWIRFQQIDSGGTRTFCLWHIPYKNGQELTLSQSWLWAYKCQLCICSILMFLRISQWQTLILMKMIRNFWGSKAARQIISCSSNSHWMGLHFPGVWRSSPPPPLHKTFAPQGPSAHVVILRGPGRNLSPKDLINGHETVSLVFPSQSWAMKSSQAMWLQDPWFYIRKVETLAESGSAGIGAF